MESANSVIIPLESLSENERKLLRQKALRENKSLVEVVVEILKEKSEAIAGTNKTEVARD